MSDYVAAPNIIGLTGSEDPLTDDDIVFIVTRAHAPWEAARIIRGEGRYSTQRGGGGGFLRTWWHCDPKGIHARRDESPVRGGLIRWREVDNLILERAQAAPEHTRALLAALDGYHAVRRRAPTAPAGQVAPPPPETDQDEPRRHHHAAREAWAAIMAAEPARQLDLF